MRSTTISVDDAADDAADELASMGCESRSEAFRRSIVYAREQVEQHGLKILESAGPYDELPGDRRSGNRPPQHFTGEESGNKGATGRGGRLSGRAPNPGDRSDGSGNGTDAVGLEPDEEDSPSPGEQGDHDSDGTRGGLFDSYVFGGVLREDEEDEEDD